MTESTVTEASSRPLDAAVGAIFVPVADIEAARDWYVELLGYPTVPEILFGHLAVFVLGEQSSDLVLDSKIYRADEHRSTPLFHFNAGNAEQAREHVRAIGAIEVSDIQHNQWFTFADPYGNVLMVRQND